MMSLKPSVAYLTCRNITRICIPLIYARARESNEFGRVKNFSPCRGGSQNSCLADRCVRFVRGRQNRWRAALRITHVRLRGCGPRLQTKLLNTDCPGDRKIFSRKEYLLCFFVGASVRSGEGMPVACEWCFATAEGGKMALPRRYLFGAAHIAQSDWVKQ